MAPQSRARVAALCFVWHNHVVFSYSSCSCAQTHTAGHILLLHLGGNLQDNAQIRRVVVSLVEYLCHGFPPSKMIWLLCFLSVVYTSKFSGVKWLNVAKLKHFFEYYNDELACFVLSVGRNEP